MTYWNSKGIHRICSDLQDSARRIRAITEKCVVEFNTARTHPNDRKNKMELIEAMLALAELEDSVADRILAISSIYENTEQIIADYFDLVIQRVPVTEIGISTLESLREHEDQMPFERRP